MRPESAPMMYHELASWWPLLSAPEDYAEEAAFYRKTLTAACVRPPTSLLELGSGGGNNAFHLKRHFQMTLVDVAQEMIVLSEKLNPECQHVRGDMRTVRLNREFDCVFVHDAVCYMTTQNDLQKSMETAFVHCRAGGAALFAPDHTRETFRASTSHGGHDAEERALRYLAWTWDPDPADETYVVDYAYMLRDTDGALRVANETHVEGLFAQADWIRLLTEVGFEAEMVPFEHSELPDNDYYVFVCRKSARSTEPFSAAESK